MKTQQSGFTLIELVMVIVILGILAASVIPNFIDLSDEAEAAALTGVAGTISSAAAINFGAHSAGDTNAAVFVDGTDTCTTIADAILADGIPAGYTLPTATLTQDNGDSVTCAVTQTSTLAVENATVIWAE